VVGLAGTFGFVKINGQPFHIFFVNFLQTMFRPPMRVWDKAGKSNNDEEDCKTYIERST
jgi:hypothetical protein